MRNFCCQAAVVLCEGIAVNQPFGIQGTQPLSTLLIALFCAKIFYFFVIDHQVVRRQGIAESSEVGAVVRCAPVREDKSHRNLVCLAVTIGVIFFEETEHFCKLFCGGRNLCSYCIQPFFVDESVVINVRVVKNGRHTVDISICTGDHFHQVRIFLFHSLLEIRSILIDKII